MVKRKILIKGFAFLAGLCVVVTLSAFNALAQSIPIPKTGQTISYFPYDDGDLQTGVAWPDPRFTDKGNGTVVDNLTGLTWTQDANLPINQVTWDTALALCENLDLGGETDWRLPNIREMESLLDWGLIDSLSLSLPEGHPFTNAQVDYFWSSTSLKSSPTLAWTMYLGRGEVLPVPKSSSSINYAMCVSGKTSKTAPVPKTGQTNCYDSSGAAIECAGTGQDGEYQAGVAWPSSRFTDNGDSTVTDNLTALMWTQDAQAIPGTMQNENTAREAADALVFASYDDWRLPNILELWSLIDFGASNPALPDDHPFTNVETGFYQSSYYWSNSIDQGGFWGPNYMGWGVNMSSGYITSWFMSSAIRAWPVRGVSGSTISGGCPLNKALTQKEHVTALRSLRDIRLRKSKGTDLVSMYYAHASEISNILAKNSMLNNRLKNLVGRNMATVEALIVQGRVSVNKDVADNIVLFLQELKKSGSKRLGKDIDGIVKGIRGGALLKEVGIRIQ